MSTPPMEAGDIPLRSSDIRVAPPSSLAKASRVTPPMAAAGDIGSRTSDDFFGPSSPLARASHMGSRTSDDFFGPFDVLGPDLDLATSGDFGVRTSSDIHGPSSPGAKEWSAPLSGSARSQDYRFIAQDLRSRHENLFQDFVFVLETIGSHKSLCGFYLLGIHKSKCAHRCVTSKEKMFWFNAYHVAGQKGCLTCCARDHVKEDCPWRNVQLDVDGRCGICGLFFQTGHGNPNAQPPLFAHNWNAAQTLNTDWRAVIQNKVVLRSLRNRKQKPCGSGLDDILKLCMFNVFNTQKATPGGTRDWIKFARETMYKVDSENIAGYVYAVAKLAPKIRQQVG